MYSSVELLPLSPKDELIVQESDCYSFLVEWITGLKCEKKKAVERWMATLINITGSYKILHPKS